MDAGEAKPLGWRDVCRILGVAMQSARPMGVCEGGPRRHVDERLVQCIWFDHLLGKSGFQTASGTALEIVDPGRWNTSSGPDFLGAAVRLAGEERRGDVEIHVDSSDWRAHAHHADPAYNQCILHAFLWAGDDRPHDVTQDGKRVERFEMAPCVEPDLETLRRTIPVEEYPYGRPSTRGLCHSRMMGMEEGFLARMLDLAGQERIESKIKRLSDQLIGESCDQVFYQALMTSQGHKSQKTLYFLLSKRVRLEELYDHTRSFSGVARMRAMEAIWLKVGGLWESSLSETQSIDEETEDYRRECEEVWNKVAGYFSDRRIPPTRRWWKGVRPANFPSRRLAGVAHLLTRLEGQLGPVQTLFRDFQGLGDCPIQSAREASQALQHYVEILAVQESEDYWSHRFSMGGKRSPKSLALIGDESARSLLFNVVLPMGILMARRENNSRFETGLLSLVNHFPSLASNEITVFMEQRLFGEDARLKRLLKKEIRRQALFQIFSSFCNNNELTCSDCALLNPVGSLLG